MRQNCRAGTTGIIPTYTHTHTWENKTTAYNKFSVVKRWSAWLLWQRDKMKKNILPWSLLRNLANIQSLLWNLYYFVLAIVTWSGSADAFQRIQTWWWNFGLALSLPSNRKLTQFKFSRRFCTYESGSKSKTEEWHIEIYKYFELSDTITCNVDTITFSLYLHVNHCLPLEPVQR